MQIHVRLTFMLGLAFGLASCSAAFEPGGDKADLRRNRARWESQRIDDYRYTLQISCFCAYRGPGVIEVRNNTVASVRLATTGETAKRGEAPSATVLDLFEVVERAIEESAERLDVSYHPELGYPTQITVDYRESWADDEAWYTASALAPLR